MDMDDGAPVVLLRETVRLPLPAVQQGVHRMLLVDIELRAVYDIIRPYVRWLDITVPSARQYPLVSAAHRLIRRPSFCLHIPPNALQEPLVIVVDRLRGVNLSARLLLSLSFYEVVQRGRPRVRISITTSSLGYSNFAYGDGTPMAVMFNATADDIPHGTGDYTMDSAGESSDEEDGSQADDGVADGDDM